MAVRVQTYVGLLYQDLIRAERRKAGDLLPPVLPIVLYNGETPWNAQQVLATLIETPPGPLADYRSQQRYMVIDEIRVAERGKLPAVNLCSALFELEASRTPERVLAVIQALIAWLAVREQASLRRAFTVWLTRVFLPKRLPSADFTPIHDLHEVTIMLSRTESWEKQWEQRGLEKGLEQGLAAERRLLVRQVRRRFGAEAAQISAGLLEGVTDTRVLEDLGERLFDSQDATDWLGVLETEAKKAAATDA